VKTLCYPTDAWGASLRMTVLLGVEAYLIECAVYGKIERVTGSRDDKKERAVEREGPLPRDKAVVGMARSPFPSGRSS
jgi:hypothetical protein